MIRTFVIFGIEHARELVPEPEYQEVRDLIESISTPHKPVVVVLDESAKWPDAKWEVRRVTNAKQLIVNRSAPPRPR